LNIFLSRRSLFKKIADNAVAEGIASLPPSSGGEGLSKVNLFSDLALTAVDGTACVVLDEDLIYVFDLPTTTWKSTGISGGGSVGTGDLTQVIADGLYAEISHTHGEFTSLQGQIDTLGNGMTFQAEVATYAAINTQYVSKVKGDTFVVTTDETRGNARSLYTYNGTSLVYLGAFGVSAGVKINDTTASTTTTYSSSKSLATFALKSHTHTGYAPTSHTHTGFAPTNHVHAAYDAYAQRITDVEADVLAKPDIDDSTASDVNAYSSNKVNTLIAAIPTGGGGGGETFLDLSNNLSLPLATGYAFNQKAIFKDMIYMIKKIKNVLNPQFATEAEMNAAGYVASIYSQYSTLTPFKAFDNLISTYTSVNTSLTDPGWVGLSFSSRKIAGVVLTLPNQLYYPADISIETSINGTTFVERVRTTITGKDANKITEHLIEFAEVDATNVKIKVFSYGPTKIQGRGGITKIDVVNFTKEWQVLSERFNHSDILPSLATAQINDKLIKNDEFYYVKDAEGTVEVPDATFVPASQAAMTNAGYTVETYKMDPSATFGGHTLFTASLTDNMLTLTTGTDIDPSYFIIGLLDVKRTNKIKIRQRGIITDPKRFKVYVSADNVNFDLFYETTDFRAEFGAVAGSYYVSNAKFFDVRYVKVVLFDSYHTTPKQINFYEFRILEATKKWQPLTIAGYEKMKTDVAQLLIDVAALKNP
jgi:hypothetical protein